MMYIFNFSKTSVVKCSKTVPTENRIDMKTKEIHYPHAFFKKASGILQSPPSVRPSVTLSPPKPLDEIQPNLVCELLT